MRNKHLRVLFLCSLLGDPLEHGAGGATVKPIENPRVGGSIPPLATNTQCLTVLGWAFSFARGLRHAGVWRIDVEPLRPVYFKHDGSRLL
ncbi:MAG: hypothetical protein ACKOFK_06135, partial [Betaproteobacteria bacterium]